jgi:DNA-binding CsgD family transcriptional regulator
VLGGKSPVPAEPRFRLELARWTGRVVDTGDASRLAAQLRCARAAAGGDDYAAVAAGLTGLTGPTEVAWQDADTHLTVARCQHRLGQPEAAIEHAEQATALLRRWPGTRRDSAAELLAQLRAGTELTAREREVLGCVAAGMSNQQVATSLGISIRTVTVHVSNLLRKTGSSSRTEAAMWAVRQGLSA